MTTPPSWVMQLLPAAPTGANLLATERAGSNVDSGRIAELIHGGRAELASRARVEAAIASEPRLDMDESASWSRVEKIEHSLERGKVLKRMRKQHNWTDTEYGFATRIQGDGNVYNLHDSAFLRVLKDQSTDEQKAAFLPDAEADRIIGCYAQTELAHGSNVRGLETTATWDPSDKTFIIHSPAITSAKWWIGSMGRTANYAMVMAQLIVGGKNIGPNTFLVPIRDLKTHEPLPNVFVGDIGPKVGYNLVDNGFAIFNQHKIPHLNMMARFGWVDPATNTFKRRGSPTLTYGGMTYLRVGIAFDAATALARGAAVAIRYTAVRQQFQDEDDPNAKGETAVLNYKMVQYRLLPALARAYALHFAGRDLQALFNRFDTAMRSDQNAALAILGDLHLTSCAMKTYATTVAVENIEVCRRSMGGHGYSAYAGLGHLYGEQLPSATYEGDNYVLTKQVARSLLKSAGDVLTGKGGDSALDQALKHYAERKDTGAAFDVLNDDEQLVAAYGWRVAHQTFEILRLRMKAKETWNNLLVPIWRLSTAYSEWVTVRAFHARVTGVGREQLVAAVGAPSADAIAQLFRLYALITLEERTGDFAESGAVNAQQFGLARHRAIGQVIDNVRPHALNLAEGWGLSDLVLNSSLGRSDGNGYEDMFRKAASNPVNGLTFDPDPNSDVMIKRRDRLAKL